MWSWVGPTNAPPDSMVAPALEAVVEHPAADSPPGLDEQHRPATPGDAASGHEPGDAAADHDHVDLRRQRALEGAGGHRVGEAAEGQAAQRQPGSAQQRAAGEVEVAHVVSTGGGCGG